MKAKPRGSDKNHKKDRKGENTSSRSHRSSKKSNRDFLSKKRAPRDSRLSKSYLPAALPFDLICSSCQKPIEKVLEAIVSSQESVVHFDCYLKQLEEKHPLQKGESFAYLGNGQFGIISKVKEREFEIKERFASLKLESRLEWQESVLLQIDY